MTYIFLSEAADKLAEIQYPDDVTAADAVKIIDASMGMTFTTPSVENNLLVLRCIAAAENRAVIAKLIEAGRLTFFSPITKSKINGQSAKDPMVNLDELRMFIATPVEQAAPDKPEAVKQSAPVANVEPMSEKIPSGKDIPGQMPKVGSRKMAVKAAWEIECTTGRVALAKEVITLLQDWADKGTEPEFLIKSEKSEKGVLWRTGKGKGNLFDLGACKKALETWMKSRQ